jgi:Peptidase family M28
MLPQFLAAGTGRPVHGDGIDDGANDDAAGTTAVLQLAHALAAGLRTKRAVLFACCGSEEIGLLGSRYFVQHLPISLTDLIANIEFEMLGYQDPKMPKGELSLIQPELCFERARWRYTSLPIGVGIEHSNLLNETILRIKYGRQRCLSCR